MSRFRLSVDQPHQQAVETHQASGKLPFGWTLIGVLVVCAAFWAVVFKIIF
jgi:hypothetical protein